MGKILDKYISEFVPQLEEIVLGQPQQAGPGMQQPGGGASAFALPEDPAMPQGSAFPSPEQAPPGDMPPGAMPPPGGGAPMAPPGDPSIPMDESQFAPPPQPGMEEAAQAPMQDGDINSFDDLMAGMDEEKIEVGITTMEEATGKPIEELYEDHTGNPPPEGISRNEIGGMLFEFGLRMLSHSGQYGTDTFGALGKAGMETLQTKERRDISKRDAKIASEEAEVNRRLKEAQIRNEGASSRQVVTLDDGTMGTIDLADPSSAVVPLTDVAGEAIRGTLTGNGGRQLARTESQLAYESAYCEGLTGDAAKKCKQTAVLWSKSGSSVIQDEKTANRATLTVFEMLNHEDNQNKKHSIVRNGKRQDVKWKNMTQAEQEKEEDRITQRLVSRMYKVKGDSGGGANTNEFGLSPEDLASIPEGKVAELDDGRFVKMQDGQPVEVVPPGQ